MGKLRWLRINQGDNVAVAIEVIPKGRSIDVEGRLITVRQPIPAGHKFALEDIPQSGHVLKYGEVIGYATELISTGDHVHLHNIKSLRDHPEAKEIPE